MCEMTGLELVQELRKEEHKITTWSIVQWNGMSWDYMTIALAADDISDDDRSDMKRIARKALLMSAGHQIGLLGCLWIGVKSLVRAANKNTPIELLASTKGLPPEPGPIETRSVDVGGGPMDVEVVPEDKHRVRRRRAICARVLLRLEREPDWKPSQADLSEIARSVGARVLAPA